MNWNVEETWDKVQLLIAIRDGIGGEIYQYEYEYIVESSNKHRKSLKYRICIISYVALCTLSCLSRDDY